MTLFYQIDTYTGFYTKGRPLIISNLICPLDKLSWQPGCPVLDINLQGNFCIMQGNGSSGNLLENLVQTPDVYPNTFLCQHSPHTQ